MAQDLATLLGLSSLTPQTGGPVPGAPQPAGPYQGPSPGMSAANPTMPPPPVPNANPMGMAPGNQLGGLMPPQAQGQQGGLSVPMLLNLLKLISSGANRGNQMMNPAPQPTDQYSPISTGGIRG